MTLERVQMILNVSRDGDFPTALSSLFQRSAALHSENFCLVLRPGEGAAGTTARPGRPQGGGRGEAEEEGTGARQEQGHGQGQSREVGDRGVP